MPIKRCANPKCRKSFVAKVHNHKYCSNSCLWAVTNARRLAKQAEAKNAKTKVERPPCWDCDFLNDCRHNVKRGRDPYCFASNPLHGQFVERYQDGRGGASLTMIARTVASAAGVGAA